jgi:hypothetical protein
MSSQISDLINPMRLRLGIKRAFTGDVNEILSECFQFYFILICMYTIRAERYRLVSALHTENLYVYDLTNGTIFRHSCLSLAFCSSSSRQRRSDSTALISS